jgi:predicted dithiol-disulfide oxidoreductase (DUF899 family)
MEHPHAVSRDEWLVRRKALLVKEKELTHQRDALNAERRRLPMVEIDKAYVFEAPGGRRTLLDLFGGRRQLIVYHFMFEPDREEGCPSCSYVVDNIGHLSHLHARDTTLVLVSRAPLAKIEPFKRRMGWSVPWVSSWGSDFNYDFHVTMDQAVAPVDYNYRGRDELERLGLTYHLAGEQPGASVFLRDGDRVFHAYSTYGRGLDLLDGTSNWLDLTPLGRQEGWDGMPDLNGQGKFWVRHHDRYDTAAAKDADEHELSAMTKNGRAAAALRTRQGAAPERRRLSASPLLDFGDRHGLTEFVEPLDDVFGNEGLGEEIVRHRRRAALTRQLDGCFPVLRLGIAPAKPQQRDEFRLLAVVEAPDLLADLLPPGIARVVLQCVRHIVVDGIRAGVGNDLTLLALDGADLGKETAKVIKSD